MKQELAGAVGLGHALGREVHVGLVGEDVGQVGGAFAVAQQYEVGHGVGR